MMRIEEVAALLERALEAAENDLQARIDNDRRLGLIFTDFTPWEYRDSNGRYILLDAVTALAQLRAVL